MLISLGYSCQSRFSIDEVLANPLRFPFDFNITTRGSLLRSLVLDGQNLIADPARISVYTMPNEQRQGVECDGIFFWHDYPLEEDGKALSPGFEEKLETTNQKYAYLWPRFRSLIRSDAPKTFVISNTQSNLQEFATSDADFQAKFGLDQIAHAEIRDALEVAGARNFQIRFLTRSLSDFHACLPLTSPAFECIFAGPMALPTHRKIVMALVDGAELSDIRKVCGSYNDGARTIEQVSDRAAIIRQASPNGLQDWGVLRSGLGGYIAAFAGGRDLVFTCALDDQQLSFSNNTRWPRSKVPS